MNKYKLFKQSVKYKWKIFNCFIQVVYSKFTKYGLENFMIGCFIYVYKLLFTYQVF